MNIVSWEDTGAVSGDAAALEPAILTLLCNSVDVALLQLQLISLASPVRVKSHITEKMGGQPLHFFQIFMHVYNPKPMSNQEQRVNSFSFHMIYTGKSFQHANNYVKFVDDESYITEVVCTHVASDHSRLKNKPINSSSGKANRKR